MNGAESLVATLAAGGVDTCFANPGTTELPLVAALDAVGGIRSVLGLFEGVCTGAADGYGRMTGRAAMALLHLGPGLANGLANLHNARRARTPLLTVVGDHATTHRAADPPLASDIRSLAAPVSGWVGSATAAASLAADGATALLAAGAGTPATLIVPSDCQWDPAEGPVAVPGLPPPAPVAEDAVARAADVLRRRPGGVLHLGGAGLHVRGLRAAGRIAAATGCRLTAETFPARWERGGDLPAPERLPYFPEQALAALDGPGLVLAGADAPVAFFAYPGLPGSTVPDGVPVAVLAAPHADVADALERLAERLGATAAGAGPPPPPLPAAPSDRLTPDAVGAVLARTQPEGAIVVDEAVTSAATYVQHARGAPRHTYLSLTGGAIGQGPPCATGAAVACPGRPVLGLQADGSALYTLQALWTQAREGLDVTTLLCANGAYRILQVELARAGRAAPGPAAAALTDLSGPSLDWVRLAEGFGVPGRRVTTAGELTAALAAALAEPGPHLVEVVL